MLIESLISQTGLSRSKLCSYADTASQRYVVYEIPKRRGGFRKIEHPSRQIKAIQRWLNIAFIGRLPVHKCATAYLRGSSIRENASRHLKSNFTLRVDFKDFFPSFKSDHIKLFLKELSTTAPISLDEADILFIQQIVCRNNALTIGAPSSPILTNAMMYDYDFYFSGWCSQRDMIYSRYADDIFISTREPNKLNEALDEILTFSSNYRFASLTINNEKTSYLSRRYRRTITGLIITPERTLSIGKERKMRLKSDIYAFKKQRLPADEWRRVIGTLAFVSDVEPAFYQILIRKYGVETINSLKELKLPIIN